MTAPDPRWLKRAKLIAEELARVLSTEPAVGSSGALAPVLVAFQGRSDALPFLRTVPTGTSCAELERLAAAYCATHPPPREDGGESEDDHAPAV